MVELTKERGEWVQEERRRTMREMMVNKKMTDKLLWGDEEEKTLYLQFENKKSIHGPFTMCDLTDLIPAWLLDKNI